ncbi:hypothetical protein BVU17_16135 [Haloarcula taiwanensis]|uniref:Uncharacterized protein n=1 Tax=Haloarcula taiwanensis TaxID=1932004 RepID=A0A2H5A2Y7_9EURY|nr:MULTISPECIES: hypothetical protein [Haloarcula]AUG49108.1 hypothetical protein BVU17_16135 [Haloarcula taiwanensis]RLM34469.1 hypothetical protein DVK01_12290 [Haloarcula sp. Atlit-120R]RLM43886.1 hypothetical protein DVK00_12485 [Haloarcula sp. Atlit-47R]
MKRRTVLAGVLPFLQGGRWLDQLLLVNQGEIVQKRFVGIAEGETTEIASIDNDETTVSSKHEGQLGQSPGEISTAVATSLRETYDSVQFQVTVDHADGTINMFSRTGSVEYRASRTLYNGVTVGDHISFQTSLLNRDTIISLSCLAKEEESLQRRCRVDIEDPTG